MTKSIRLVAVVSLALMLVALWGQRVQALPPTVMMFYGEPLKNTILVTGADTLPFGDLLTPSRQATAPDLASRTFLNVALFIGPPDNPAANGTPLARLTPQMAMQHARFYLATATQPAVLMVTDFVKQSQGVPAPDSSGAYRSPHVLSPEALAVLKKHGIPTGALK